MAQNPAAAAFLVSVQSIAQVLTIIAIGALATRNGLMAGTTRKAFATFALKVFFPCLVLSTAKSYNAEQLVDYLPLMGFSLFHILLGALLGGGAGRLLKLPRPDRHFLLLMTAFNNNGGLPFILFMPLVSTWQRALDEGSPDQVLPRVYAMITIYCFPWTFALFTLGKRVIIDSGRPADRPGFEDGGLGLLAVATSEKDGAAPPITTVARHPPTASARMLDSAPRSMSMLALSEETAPMSEEDLWGVREEEGNVNPLGGDNQHKTVVEGASCCGASSGDVHRDEESHSSPLKLLRGASMKCAVQAAKSLGSFAAKEINITVVRNDKAIVTPA